MAVDMLKETKLSSLDYEKLLEVLGHKGTQPILLVGLVKSPSNKFKSSLVPLQIS